MTRGARSRTDFRRRSATCGTACGWLSRILISLCFLAASLAPGTAGAVSSSPVSATSVRRGLRLTISVAKPTYPVNALVPVTIVARNVSRHNITITRHCTGGYYSYLEARVIDAVGRMVYPPPIVGQPPDPCHLAPPDRVLRSGQSMRTHDLVVLRSRRVTPVVVTFVHHGVNTANPVSVGEAITLRLTKAPPPTAVIVHGPAATYVALTAPPGAIGPLRYQFWVVCASPDGETSSVGHTRRWYIAAENRFLPLFSDCPTPSEWHAVAGWMDGPVATVDYTAPAGEYRAAMASEGWIRGGGR